MEDPLSIVVVLTLALVIVARIFFGRNVFSIKRILRRNYYRNVYLKSDDWRRKRYVVLKRDSGRCVYCASRATQVHHKKYARNIGMEPIKWLVSVCQSCHDRLH